MSPNERQKKLFEYLEILDEWITVKELARSLGVSERTLHTDINVVNKNIKEVGSVIEKKRGVGVKLINHLNADTEKNSQEIENINDRKIQIISMLLVQNKVVTYNNLADTMFVSPTSIKNDLDEIKENLSSNTNVRIVSDLKGTKIEGNEVSIREALVWFNQEVIERTSLSHKSNMSQIKQIFKQFYREDLVDVAYDILFSFVLKHNSLLSDYYILNTLNVYIVQLHRLLGNNAMSDSIIVLREADFGDLSDFTAGSEELLSRASSRLELEYTQNDINFLAKYLVLNRFEHIPSEAANDMFIEELVEYLSDALEVNFKKDSQLMKELKQHVPPMIYRLKLKVRAENPFVEQIKSEFPQTFHTILLALSNFESKLEIEFNDDEVALLTIYFQSAIEKKRKNNQILVVCQYGIATSELLVNRLKNELSAIDKIESASVGELQYFDLDDYDLIISSTDSIKGKNVIHVSPFLNTQDIDFIKDKLKTETKKENETDVVIQNIYPYLYPKYIFPEADFNNRESLLEQINSMLRDEDYVEDSYIDSLIHRESIGNTDLPSGVAIPHGDINLVNKSMIVIINNKNKIHWNKYFVDRIFILLISKEDTMETKKIIKELYALINDKKIMNNFNKYLLEVKGDLTN